jgi:hypothetical protein
MSGPEKSEPQVSRPQVLEPQVSGPQMSGRKSSAASVGAPPRRHGRESKNLTFTNRIYLACRIYYVISFFNKIFDESHYLIYNANAI